MNKNMYILLVFLIAGFLYPLVLPGYLTVAITVMIFAGWASSWNILGGWAGQLSLGHASFVGLGAYFVAVGVNTFGLAPWWSIILAMLTAAFLAYLWGKMTFSLRGPYFSLSTIAVAEILRLVAINEKWLTGGATGVFIETLPEPFGIDLFSKNSQYYLAFIYALITISVTIYISTQKFGYELRAIREDEDAAMAAGINPVSVKLRAFILSAALTAFGGGVYGVFLSFIEPHLIFNLLISVQIALTVIIGGRGTVWGPVVGSIVLVGVGEFFRTSFAQANMLVYGILILVVILLMPRGIVGELIYKFMRRKYANFTRSK